MVAYDDGTLVYDDSSRTYEGGILRTATGAGLSSSTANWNTFDPNDQYDESTITYDELTRTYDGSVGVNATGSGLSFSSTTYVRTTFSSGIAAGEGGETAVGLRIVPKTATGSGGATAGDTAIGLRTVPRVSTSAGVGASTSYGATSHLRAASGAGVGSSETVSFATLFRSASPSAGQGSLDVAIWANRGQPMRGKVILQPYWSKRKPYYIPR